MPKTYPVIRLLVLRPTASVKASRCTLCPSAMARSRPFSMLMDSIGITGCQINRFSDSSQASPQRLPETHPTGIVMGGQQPVSGNLIQLYAVGTTGDSSTATTLIHTTLTTSDGTGQPNSNANAGNSNNSLPAGSFTITGDYTCPSASSEVYLVGTGGNPGMPQGTNNPTSR